MDRVDNFQSSNEFMADCVKVYSRSKATIVMLALLVAIEEELSPGPTRSRACEVIRVHYFSKVVKYEYYL